MRIAKAYCKCGTEIYEADCVDGECEFNRPHDWSRSRGAPDEIVGCAVTLNSWCTGIHDTTIEDLEHTLRIVVSRLYFWEKSMGASNADFDAAVKALLEASLSSMAECSYV